ncbi:hypothetical protein Pan189_21510 [Stratiformator vulcanicus]|uniref:Uncharacterized protein n=1 Tax=Stratiformator vulcanicus TaxID=2527980 RepID=A0A517R1K1_9PLAN|nr:hypothetical protein Pan189_21510 [Stratiformator vulcanicus]
MATVDSPDVEPKPQPVLRVTRYDVTLALVVAFIISLVVVVLWLSGVWAAVHVWQKDEAVPLEMITLSGGSEDGTPDETFDLESPYEEIPDPTLAELRSDETEIEPLLEAVVELSDVATQQAEQQLALDARSAGNPGSADGTGNKALGVGDGDSGVPREQRWFIRFADGATSEEYARQLDFFGIEIGALVPGGRLAYLSSLTSPSPTVRMVNSGAGENRLYMTWQGGGRKSADLKLLRKANVDVGSGTIFHFYPPRTEALLAQLEKSYRGASPKDVRRTYFVVQRKGSDFEFAVTRQTYFR